MLSATLPTMRGFLRKMTTSLNAPVDYHLPLDEQEIHLNPYIGDKIRLTFHGRIHCLHCGRATKKSFSQGYCYPCFRKLAQCDLCVMSPEKCHYDQGTCRDPKWGEDFCMQSHIVYFANSSGVKVGITRPSQIPTRWIDQGAVQAIPVLRVSSRQISGLAEVVFKAHITDRTQWQKMLKDEQPELDLKEIRDDLMSIVGDELSDLQNKYGLQAVQTLPDEDVQSIEFPVLEYPTKVKSMNFDKTPVIEGLLLGIKGQYLIFDTGVLNMRKFTSYDVELNPVSAGLF